MTTASRPSAPQQPVKRHNARLIIRVLMVVVVVLLAMLLFNEEARARLIITPAAASPATMPTPTPTAHAVPTGPAASWSAPTPVPTKPAPSSVLGPPYKGLPTAARVKVPRLKIDAPMVPVGLTGEGEVEPPPSHDSVGWYNLSPVPGSPGNSVLVGHVDWKNQTAVFWDLRKIQPGDTISIASPDRAEAAFVVEWMERYPFDQAPIDKIFASLYEPALTLITCEGEFNQATRNYSLRLVVRARAQ